MKNILVPTDFSDSSKAAASYAIALAKIANAKITFFHVYHIPMITSEAAIVMPTYENLESDSLGALQKFENDLKLAHGFTGQTSCVVKPGFLIDEMKEYISENNIDLVIMGINGLGKMAEILIGSNATIAIHNINCPVLVVPNDSIFKPISNIAFACDLIKVKDTAAMEKIKMWAKTFNAHLHILNIVAPDEKPNFEKAIAGVQLESIFDNINHSLFFPENDDITYAINDFVEKHNIDLVIMIPRKHNIISSLFHASNTKKMAFHTHIPLLTIHD
ncbi:MAG: universal stress protein [Bacteroidetes bacterium]|nr:universal stress protein [Bacteroidota bacterium]